MRTPNKKRASTHEYVSSKQLVLEGFETPFHKELNPNNRWVELSSLLPWDEICNLYLTFVPVAKTGRPPLNPRVVMGAIIIKHLCNLDDRETVAQISENIYMQYFLGYSSFSDEVPFDASLFVEFRKRLGLENLNAINAKIVALKTEFEKKKEHPKSEDDSDDTPTPNKGILIMDATACPQNIGYPTDLNLLNDAREKSEQLIDYLFCEFLHEKKPRTYRKKARTIYLKTAQSKKKSHVKIRIAVKRQLNFLKRNLKSIEKLLDYYAEIPFEKQQYKYYFVIQQLYEQQNQMYINKTHTIADRIVSIHQPHVRPIVRGKAQSKVEFGAKIHASLVDGITFLDELSWDAFNEGSHLAQYVELYKTRFKCYPRELLVDKIYCTRANRKMLQEKGIRLKAKPLGRPSALPYQVSPGERNPIEGKFGQAKTAYGLGCIKARLQNTSESWIASIILVLNLVKLAGVVSLWIEFIKQFSFSASIFQKTVNENRDVFKPLLGYKYTKVSTLKMI